MFMPANLPHAVPSPPRKVLDQPLINIVIQTNTSLPPHTVLEKIFLYYLVQPLFPLGGRDISHPKHETLSKNQSGYARRDLKGRGNYGLATQPIL